ncbi:MAG: COX15/CtaA family protein [Nitratireductor sp.]|nr:COX15/CtaA family protein [Nitratireductor sp.]
MTDNPTVQSANIFGQGDGHYTYVEAIVTRERRNRAMVRFWLYFVCLMLFAMVLVGGATRLTDSGLSITEWKPIHGIIPPLSASDWAEEFAKYRQIPEYEQINKGMSLAEFQFIYWWEWSHRFLGRMIGFVFFIPLVFFWATGRLESRLKPRLLFLLFLGGLQGFIGWWMVKSGLSERVDVSQYRLAIHLTLASLIFAYAFWLARGLAPHSTKLEPPARLSLLAPLVLLLVFVQIFMGGLVAGLDAGLASNEWPMMLGSWVPPEISQMSPLWLNWFENPVSVQWNHRLMGYILFSVIVVQWLVARASTAEKPHKRRTMFLFLIVLVQVILGITTVLMSVPLHVALTHQGVAIILLAATVAHWRGLVGPYPPVTDIEVRR